MSAVRSSLALAVGALLILSACSAEDSPGAVTNGEVMTTAWGAQVLERGEPRSGGTLRFGMPATVESLDPAGSALSGNTIMRGIYGVLFSYDGERNLVPDMAESIESEDGGSTWTLKIRPGYTFTDGTPYNAAAVQAHFERLAADGSRSRSSGDMREIDSMTVTDDLTLEIALRQQWSGFPHVLVGASPGGPAMVPSPAAVETFGEALATNPVGAGPFILESFQPGGDAVLVRNPDYGGEPPYLDRIEFVTATDTQSRVAAGIAGDLDLGRTQSAVDLQAAVDGGLLGLTQPDLAFYHMIFNLTAAPFDDVRFRKAVAHAVDVDALNSAVFDGAHDTMVGFMPSTNPHFVDTEFPEFDLDTATNLVEEYTSATGNAAEFTLTVGAPPEVQQQAAVLQQMLSDAGITMNIRVSDQPTIVSEARAGNFEAQFRYAELNDQQDLRRAFHSTSGGNNGLKGDAEVDRILDAMLTAPEEAMGDLYSDLQHALSDWMPQLPLVLQKNGVFVSDRVGGHPGNVVGISDPDLRRLWVLSDD